MSVPHDQHGPEDPAGPVGPIAPGSALRVAAALVLHAGRVLVQTRPAGRTWEGWWEFPGGKLEPGEDVAGCAEREVLEETGLAVTAGAVLHEVRWERPASAVHVSFVLCAPRAPVAAAALPEAHPREGQRLSWASADELGALRFLPANASLLPLLAARLRLSSA
ncbi:MAG TPA: NUDIX domain-containing protein [Planctomycetota bacterium]|nr:NUDIX domain-containing protein [Planctomycetota bacterium]